MRGIRQQTAGCIRSLLPEVCIGIRPQSPKFKESRQIIGRIRIMIVNLLLGESIGGHAVRCMYLYCGMADVAAIKHNPQYIDALNRLWTDVVERNMYITGGIGSSRHNEGFTEDYDLPNLEAYCETCASVGMVLWNHRMNQFTGDSKYIDVLERSMYNGALAGISLNGDRFFYVNPLESKGDHHRLPWYGCACCPSQLSRFLPSIGNYIYGISDNAIWVNLYIGNVAEVNVDGVQVTMKEETKYPWNGRIKFTINADEEINKELRLRIPGWCKKYNLFINGKKVKKLRIDKGYVVIADWNSGDNIELDFDMPVEVVKSDVRVKQNIGKRAIQRGPLVYCIEDAQNKDTIEGIYISPKTSFKTDFNVNLLNGVQQITAKDGKKTFTLIPYYAWDNMEAGNMKVWIDYKK